MAFGKFREKFQRTKSARRTWSLYKWFDRLWNWHDWYTWISAFLQTKAGVAAAIGSTAALTTAAVVTHTALVNPYSQPFVQTEVESLVAKEEERQTQTALIFAIEGRDKAGRRGTFDVVVAKKQFLWVRGSSDELEKNGVVLAREKLESEVLDAEVRAGLANAREIIAVGTASQEGDSREETARAGRRAARTAEILAAAIDGAVPISTLNLGQYRERCPTCDRGATNWQRPFMVIAVKELESGADLGEALADAMSGKDKLPSPASYSAFELARIR